MPSEPLAGVPALVLGAGFGTRLKPLTDFVPKPAIPVLGRPLLGHALAHLYAAGSRECWVNAHHMADRLEAVLDSWVQRRLLRLTVRWAVEQPRILGTGGAIRNLEEQLARDSFLLLNGDSILGLDLGAFWNVHQANRAGGAAATLLCVPRPDASRYGAVVVADDGRILDLAGLARPPGVTDDEVAAGTPCVFCGVHAIEPQVVKVLPPRGTEACIVRQGYAPLLAAGEDLRAHVVPDLFFHDVGTPDRYLDAQAALLSAGERRVLPVAEAWSQGEAIFQEASYGVAPDGTEHGRPDSVEGLAGAILEPPFFFGPRNRVEAGARIGPNASIGALNAIGAGAVVRDAALWSQVELAPGATCEGAIVARLGGEDRTLQGRLA